MKRHRVNGPFLLLTREKGGLEWGIMFRGVRHLVHAPSDTGIGKEQKQ